MIHFQYPVEKYFLTGAFGHASIAYLKGNLLVVRAARPFHGLLQINYLSEEISVYILRNKLPLWR